MPICCECLGTEEAVGSGGLISCICGTSVHPQCLHLDPAASVRLRQNGWRCDDCALCIICRKPASEVKLVMWGNVNHLCLGYSKSCHCVED